MPDSVAHIHAQLPVRVPRGQEGYWQIILKLADSKGDFTINDVDDASNVGRGDIQAYVWSLHKAGFLTVVNHGSQDRRSGRRVPAVFRLVKRQRVAPRVRRDGSQVPSLAQENLWTTIRTLKLFTLRELAFAATTDEVKPSYEATKRYVLRLTDAGYLDALSDRPGHRGSWRLKRNMDTGPKAPERRAVKAEMMWDPNRRAFVGPSPIAQEIKP